MLRNEDICVVCPDSEYMAPVRINVLYMVEDFEDFDHNSEEDITTIEKVEELDSPRSPRNSTGKATDRGTSHKQNRKAPLNRQDSAPIDLGRSQERGAKKGHHHMRSKTVQVPNTNQGGNQGGGALDMFSTNSSPDLKRVDSVNARQSKLRGLRER